MELVVGDILGLQCDAFTLHSELICVRHCAESGQLALSHLDKRTRYGLSMVREDKGPPLFQLRLSYAHFDSPFLVFGDIGLKCDKASLADML